jgi:ribosome-associated protein
MANSTDRFGLEIEPGLVIPPSELESRASRSGGPGGQHVNTSSTKVELVWMLGRSRVVSDAQRSRIRSRLAPRLDSEGNLRIVASDTRSQRQNRALAEERLAVLVRRALAIPKPRRKTKPTKSSVERRLSAKHQRSQRKQERRVRDAD